MIEFLYMLQKETRLNHLLRKANYIISSFFCNMAILPFYKIFYRYFRKMGIDIDCHSARPIIVSLTTFPARIHAVCVCIETIMRQKHKPNRIILWLAETQFNGEKSLPKHLLHLKSRGLEIRFCEDLRSHKKYYETMKENPDAVVITLDDDVYYPKYTLTQLINIHKLYPNSICCNNAKYLPIKKDDLAPYVTWKPVTDKNLVKSFLLVPIGVGGVLYPPGALHEDVFSKDDIKELCFHTDDLWLKAMSLRQGTEVVYTGWYPTLFCINQSQSYSLSAKNCGENRNDVELKNILRKYTDVLTNI